MNDAQWVFNIKSVPFLLMHIHSRPSRGSRGGRGRGRGGRRGDDRPTKTAEDLDAEMAVRHSGCFLVSSTLNKRALLHVGLQRGK